MNKLILFSCITLLSLQIQSSENTTTENVNFDRHIDHLYIVHIDDEARIHHCPQRERTEIERHHSLKNHKTCFSYNDTTIYYCITHGNRVNQMHYFLTTLNLDPKRIIWEENL